MTADLPVSHPPKWDRPNHPFFLKAAVLAALFLMLIFSLPPPLLFDAAMLQKDKTLLFPRRCDLSLHLGEAVWKQVREGIAVEKE